MKQTRRKILLVVASLFKAEGQMAMAIADILPEFDFYFFSAVEAKYRREELEKLIECVDVVHWLINRESVEEDILYLANQKKQIATVHHVCNQEVGKVKSALEANIVHVVANEWKEFIEKESRKRNVVLARLGVRTESFSKIRNPISSKVVIGMMGFYPGAFNRKRPDIAIKVFKSIYLKNSNIELCLQGAGWDDFLNELKEIDIPITIREFSTKEESDEFFNLVDILLCTSDFEGGPLPVLEALSSGIPVISTKVGLSQELLVFGGGILCEKENIDQLSVALNLLINNPELRSEYSNQAMKTSREIDWKNLKGEYYSLYSSEMLKNDESSKSFELSAEKQRHREIKHSQIQEGFSLLYHGKKWKGFVKLLGSQLDHHISFKRKINTSKRFMKFAITGVRT